MTRMVPLGSVATIDRNSVAPEDILSGTMYVGLENVQSDGSFEAVRDVDPGDLASSKFRFTTKHVLYGKLRPYLRKIARPNFEGICSTDILPILPGDAIDRNYLAHFLRLDSSVDFANSSTTGANLPRISPTALEAMMVPLPTIEEQRRIAAILDQAEALRTKRRQALAKLDTLTQSLFLEMFGDPEQDTRWRRAELGTLIVDGPQNGLYRPSEDYGSGTPILRIDAFYDGLVTSLSSLKRLRLSDQDVNRYALTEGDLVINRVNSIEYLGKSAIIPRLDEATVFESNMMRFRLDNQRVSSTFLIQLLQTAFIRRQIRMCAKDAVNQSSINQKDVCSLRVVVPPLSLQTEFSEKFQS